MSQTIVNQGASGPGVVFKKRIAFDFGEINTATTKEVTGEFSDDEAVADAGDGVFWSPSAVLTTGVVNAGARVTTTGVVAARLGNLTGTTLTPGTVTLDVYVIKGGLDV